MRIKQFLRNILFIFIGAFFIAAKPFLPNLNIKSIFIVGVNSTDMLELDSWLQNYKNFNLNLDNINKISDDILSYYSHKNIHTARVVFNLDAKNISNNKILTVYVFDPTVNLDERLPSKDYKLANLNFDANVDKLSFKKQKNIDLENTLNAPEEEIEQEELTLKTPALSTHKSNNNPGFIEVYPNIFFMK